MQKSEELGMKINQKKNLQTELYDFVASWVTSDMGLTKCRGQGGHVGIQMKAPHQELGLGSSWVNLEAWWKAHILGKVILVKLSLRGGRHGSQAQPTMLHLSHILLE